MSLTEDKILITDDPFSKKTKKNIYICFKKYKTIVYFKKLLFSVKPTQILKNKWTYNGRR
jgi:hypothetical protein